MNQLHTPKASRNQETGRLSFIPSVSPAPAALRRRGGEQRGPAGGAGPSRDTEPSATPKTQNTSAQTYRPATCTFPTVPASNASYSKKSARTNGRFRSTLLRTSALLLTASALSLTATLPAAAVDKPGDKSGKGSTGQAKPPAKMSEIGGTRLGRPGTQVDLGGGAPVLPKDLTAKSWIVADAESGDVLASHNAHWKLPPASTMKMLFADTVLPKFPKSTTHKVVPSDLAGIGAGSSSVGIKENYTYTVHDLWLGVFLRSGNDAVHVLSAMNQGVPQTVKDMQAHAEELQALDTHVVSPDGYDAPGQTSSAYDLTLFARSGLQKADFREYAATATAKFPKKQKKGKTTERFAIQNTNRLLTGDLGLAPYKGIAGVKNGNTTNAGATFTGVAERNNRVLLVTVMTPDSDEQFAVYKETARLLDWGFAADGKVTPVGSLVPPKSAAASTAPGAAGTDGDHGKAGPAKPQAHAAVTEPEGSSGIGIALAICGGILVVLAGAVFAVRKKWPLQPKN
ncbi:D-alanyl-D-alanine carboxypeptidase [Streptomyces sp. NPDC059524]|uniref:D-alanyl-D-alanine carboxypeptidase n=1 Tax=Streptomyces sp. NPDC059524 TaxID=3346856 RepID=UPI00368C18CF